MKRRRLAASAAVGICVLLAAILAPNSSTTSVVHTTGSPVDHEVAASPLLDPVSQAVGAAGDDVVAQAVGGSGRGSGNVRQGSADAGQSTFSSTQTSSLPTTSDHRPAPRVTKAAPPVTPAPNAGVQGPLHADGNTIVDANGHPVVLRGIERVGFQMPGNWPPITDAEMAHAEQWGANVVRLPLGEAYIDPQCSGQYVPGYLDSLDAVVRSITSRGMVAMLELAFVTRTPCGKSFRWKMADGGSIPFWQTVGERYKTNPLVAFDLYNEPNHITDDEWRNGGTIVDWDTTPPVQWTAVGMQQLYDAVRSTGATNLITITGNAYGGTPSPIFTDGPIRGTDIVYAAHAYTCSDTNSAAVCTSFPANRQESIEPQWQVLARRYPVMITEFGWPDASDSTYNASVIRFAQAQDPPWGWVAFGWDGTTSSPFGLVADLSSYAPTPSGRPVKNALAAPP